MVDKDTWQIMCNNVFSLLLPPEEYLEKVIYNHNGKKKVFKSMIEMMTYIALNENKTVVSKDISFVLKDDTLYDRAKDYLEKIKERI